VQQGAKRIQGVVRVDGDLRSDPWLIVNGKAPNPGIDVVVEGPPDVRRRSRGIDAGKIPLKDEIPVSQGRGLSADGQFAEQFRKPVFLCDVIIMAQGGQP